MPRGQWAGSARGAGRRRQGIAAAGIGRDKDRADISFVWMPESCRYVPYSTWSRSPEGTMDLGHA
jgi:hypothetical protein